MHRLSSIFILLFAGAAPVFGGPETIPSGKEMKEVTPVPAPTCDFSWTGFYVGLRGGYAWSDTDDFRAVGEPPALFTIDPGHQELEPDGAIGGGELGFNWQFGRWFVIGGETDFSGADLSESRTRDHIIPQFDPNVDVPLTAHQDVDWFGTVRGRIGFTPVCRLLIYGTGGFAYGDVDVRADLDFRSVGGLSHFPASHDDVRTGWAGGGGIEFAIARHWTLKAEYLYLDLGDEHETAAQIPNLQNPPVTVHYRWDNQFHTVTAGLNFKF